MILNGSGFCILANHRWPRQLHLAGGGRGPSPLSVARLRDGIFTLEAAHRAASDVEQVVWRTATIALEAFAAA